MKAVVFTGAGGNEVVRLEERPDPVPGDQDVLVRVRFAGLNLFQFTDGYSIHVHVFKALDFEGEPTETEEAAPLWFPADALPYEEMWEDDRLWIPLLLEDTGFTGRYVFEGERMLDHQLDLEREGE